MRRITVLSDNRVRSSQRKKDRHVKLGISNRIAASAPLSTETRAERISRRFIDDTPYKILDAPGVTDDFYTNILNWATTNIISIGLEEKLYQYDLSTAKVYEALANPEHDFITGVTSEGQLTAIGTNSGFVKLLVNTSVISSYKVSSARVCALAFNASILACGTKDGALVLIDCRCGKEIRKANLHGGEICGLRFSPDYRWLASGGNDDAVRISDLRTSTPRLNLSHKSAVKALSWCPWKNDELCTGGGSKDKTIRAWNTATGEILRSINVDSQVCTLNHSLAHKELISSHGFAQNNIVAWKASTFKQVCAFGKHDARVLNVAISPDGSQLISVSADENLKFWKLHEKTQQASSAPMSMQFR